MGISAPVCRRVALSAGDDLVTSLSIDDDEGVMTMKKLLVLLGVAVLLAGACGGDDDDDSFSGDRLNKLCKKKQIPMQLSPKQKAVFVALA